MIVEQWCNNIVIMAEQPSWQHIVHWEQHNIVHGVQHNIVYWVQHMRFNINIETL